MTATVSVFRGSPRPHGNTNAITDIAVSTFRETSLEVREFDLYRMNIRPCLACRQCQQDWSAITCAQQDDFAKIASEVMDSDLLVLATPIYSWYCTPPMKAMLDRMVYAFNMYYGDQRGPSLWAGKKVGLITTCGYPPEKGSDLFEEGIKRYCKHSQLQYLGMLCERHLGYNTQFLDDDKISRVREFAEQLSRAVLPATD